MKKFFLKTMGCQMNDHDSEVIRGLLLSLGYAETEEVEEADLILYNTCCVRENPERKVYGHMAGYKRLKEAKPHLLIGICGCMTQQKEERQNILRELPHVDLIFGTHNIHRLPELLARAEGGERVVEVWDEAPYEEEGQDFRENLPVERSHRLKAFVNIIYGCTNFCTYCIVPYVRGKEHSRLPESILTEVEGLVEAGYKEVTLLGQNVNAYGKDLSIDTSFSQLLTELNAIEGLARIRFTTSHPRDLGPDLIDALAGLDKVCEHLHLPVQAGSSRVLRRMNRGYTREQYLDLVQKVRQAVPEIALTTDIIVGFPGETEGDFQETLSLVEEVRFDSAFTFIYSPREGTPAARFADQVPEEVKKERIYRLIELQNKISAEHIQGLVGTKQEVLVEGTDGQGLVGRTRTNRQVHFAGSQELMGELVTVEITEAGTWTLRGRVVQPQA
ncbi:MAG: tRNA (N6-isopentenyl adenosine(37)-C2)-methylthiotransferase MiaB [Limnochordia bacterium]|jgi:tRNA-2-methylthio-N6-dimethylallyladenosine synthase|nr:tRNA (N6-isopentenyl adenosine(37)-C2)-methylthiotransferase MiaB [Limnochordia bacterium]MDI9464359.1 tRNA (N6-isopentenyl adenosine(37)-C2)-methylthiotransferase MiaB [Bacillota bacterium]NLO94558.1 tRNA (N6-isopentenyl adenosine(37)-C2)-methylthiotransferase MiaB [Bacillota bacterium]HAN94075.1 tRNA (N6-isopentenyl adenosine(37)-C2)-methylthiotransferase MiaB [Bacillota bacterium]HOB39821.1 tRNA (N6-isopentenyl adenosine(37)-C2)-methylthiotransferase MiaB [Limnochordia bacterium]